LFDYFIVILVDYVMLFVVLGNYLVVVILVMRKLMLLFDYPS